MFIVTTRRWYQGLPPEGDNSTLRTLVIWRLCDVIFKESTYLNSAVTYLKTSYYSFVVKQFNLTWCIGATYWMEMSFYEGTTQNHKPARKKQQPDGGTFFSLGLKFIPIPTISWSKFRLKMEWLKLVLLILLRTTKSDSQKWCLF